MASAENERSKARRQPSSRPPPASEAVVTDGFVLPTLDVPADAPPAYGNHLDQLQFSRTGFEAGAAVTGVHQLRFLATPHIAMSEGLLAFI